MVQVDWKKYLETYPDLRANGVQSEQQVKEHFYVYGRVENRMCKNVTI